MNVRVKLPAVRAAMEATAWAIVPEKLSAMLEVIELHAAGGSFSREEIAARTGGASKPAGKVTGSIQVLPLYGVVSQRMNMMSEMSGGTSTEQFGAQFDAAINDPSIGAIVIDVDSPGGNVAGTPELAKKIFDARGTKPIVAVANSLMASAAYWIASAADEIVASPSADVGSIGVFMVHTDVSEAAAKEGVKYTLIKAGEHKAEGNPYEPLSAEAQDYIQSQVDEFYGMFTAGIAKHRGIGVTQVRSDYGKGRTMTAKQALAAGMIDRIATLDDTLARLGAKKGALGAVRQRAAESEALPIAALSLSGVIASSTVSTSTTALAGASAPLTLIVPTSAGADDTELDPSPDHPAPKAKEHTVREDTAAAPTGAVDIKALVAAERKRSNDITALCKQEGQETLAEGFIASDKSVADVSYELMTKHRAAMTATPNIRVGETREAMKPFATLGEQLKCIVSSTLSGRIDQRLQYQAAATGMGESDPSAGGFALQPEFSQEIIQRSYTLGALLSRVRRVPIGPSSNGLKINAIDETSRANGSRLGGIQMFWANEGDAGTPKRPKMRQMELALRKLIGLWYAGDELLQDSTALTAVAEEGFAQEVTFMVEDAILNGTGSGQPLGILNSPSVVTVNKEAGQAATTFVTANAAKMFGRMFAGSVPNGIWLMNQDVWQQMLQLTIGASAWPVFIPPGQGVSVAPFGTLYGRPIVVSEYNATLGTVGDILFLDLSQYLLIDKGGPQQAQSIHVRFVNDETAFRLTYRVDGQPVWNNTLTPKNGTNTLSPFIALQAR